jgi:hypothetical protein
MYVRRFIWLMAIREEPVWPFPADDWHADCQVNDDQLASRLLLPEKTSFRGVRKDDDRMVAKPRETHKAPWRGWRITGPGKCGTQAGRPRYGEPGHVEHDSIVLKEAR